MFKFKNLILKFFVVFFLLTIFIFISAKSYSKVMFKNISNNFLRLHVVANSDSTEDQILKYKIRDSIIDFITPLFKDVTTKAEALAILNNHTEDISKLSSEISKSMGYNYEIKVEIGNFYFPTKEYSKITLPEGFYDALKIEIGDANGQNWWCVMYPSLCIIDTTNCIFASESDKLLKENLGSEEYSVITNSNNSVDLKIKFKLIELFENI